MNVFHICPVCENNVEPISSGVYVCQNTNHSSMQKPFYIGGLFIERHYAWVSNGLKAYFETIVYNKSAVLRWDNYSWYQPDISSTAYDQFNFTYPELTIIELREKIKPLL